MEKVNAFTLTLPARSENLRTVREALSDFAASLGATGDTLADLRLAVNEACSNVVRHAYGEEGGDMAIEARPIDGSLLVTVQDTGRGVSQPTLDPGSGLGLRVASAVSGSFEVEQRSQGTQVRLVFPLGEAA
jgi:anti-sigma regulatory factor (Ser/Thr protein kinase)